VVGWLRPVLLLPPAAAMGLTPTQLEAVLAHELAHIKRHDYLVNVAQVVIETLFFYHPVVWWTSHQIRVEREACCDDVAVQACGNAADYARGLAALARRQLMPLAQAATGGPLVYRIRRLLGMAPRELAAGDVAGIIVMLVAVGGILLHVDRLQAQATPTGGDRPRFEVTSVKVNASGDGIVIMQSTGSRFTARGLSAAELVRLAYRVQEFQTAGGPDWMNSVRFDIVAKYPDDASGVKDAERMMLRTLLEDRFGLMVHKETRERPVYALVSARPGTLGSQFRRSTADCSKPSPDCSGWVGPGFIRQRGKTMPQIAEEFSKLTNTGSSLNRLVVDRTGLDGRFDMDLRFTPEFIPPSRGGGPSGCRRSIPMDRRFSPRCRNSWV
jgi:bla regulator protein blaR1